MRLWLTGLIILVFTSCQQDPGIEDDTNTPLSFGDKGQLYLSVNVVDTTLTYPFYGGYKPMRHATICYDIEKDTAIWYRTDTMFVTSPIPYYGQGFISSGTQYFKNFKIGNELIRILVKEELLPLGDPNYLVPTGKYTGIYMEKRDIHTGNVLMMQRIIGAGEFNAGINNQAFALSNVINIGDRFFFGVNNNHLYCYDKDGNQVWKKNNYTPRNNNSLSSPNVAYLYNNATRLAYISQNGKLNLLDAATGNLLWSVDGWSDNNDGIELLLTNKYVFTFNKYSVDRYRLSDGHHGFDDYLRTFSTVWGSPYPNITVKAFNTFINDSTICFWTNDGNYLHVGNELAEMNGVATMNKAQYGKYLPSYPTSFFCAPQNNILPSPDALVRVDFTVPNGFIWTRNFTGASAGDYPVIDDLLTDNNRLYMVSHSNLSGYNLIPRNPDKKFGNAIYLYTIDPATGMILSKGKIFSSERYSLLDAYAITLGNR